jgi:hypothetical protein
VIPVPVILMTIMKSKKVVFSVYNSFSEIGRINPAVDKVPFYQSCGSETVLDPDPPCKTDRASSENNSKYSLFPCINELKRS